MADAGMAGSTGGSAGGDVILASAGYDHTIRFWEALSGLCVRTINYPDSQVNRLAISPDKRFLVAAGNPHVRLYDVQSNNPNPISSFEGHKGNVTSVQYQSAGRWIVTASEDGTMKVWDVRAPAVQRDYSLGHPVNDCVIHPNQGEVLTADASGAIKTWDLGENLCTHELVPEEDTPARSVAVSSDGQVVVGANNRGNLYVWRVRGGEAGGEEVEAVQKVQAHGKYITKCVMSPDTNLLATCSADHTVKIWRLVSNPSSPSSSSHPTLSQMPVPDTTDPDDPDTAAGDGDVGFVLERTLTGHQRWVWDAAFSADSAYLVTGSSDHTARLWDLSSGDAIRHYNGHQKAVVCVALHDVSL